MAKASLSLHLHIPDDLNLISSQLTSAPYNNSDDGIMTDPNALHGDGINFPFFNLLWSKNSNDDDTSTFTTSSTQAEPPSTNSATGRRRQSQSNATSPSQQRQTPILRVPDTVVFLFGQPHQWYFTSKNGGPHKDKTMILRKRRANLSLANIEEVFLSKHTKKGKDDIVAYFISSKSDGGSDQPHASLDACAAVVDNDISCNIEYFNKKSLRE